MCENYYYIVCIFIIIFEFNFILFNMQLYQV